MYFADLQASLLESLRTRVRNGQVTERGLARLVGVSQPHMHNVLKGTRFLSSELSDQILRCLNISVLDLVDRALLTQYMSAPQPSRRSAPTFRCSTACSDPAIAGLSKLIRISDSPSRLHRR
jgi:hypothetical protein